jgi:hypothetical protein
VRRCLSAAEETPEHEALNIKLSLLECMDDDCHQIPAWDTVVIRGQGPAEKSTGEE